MILVPTVVWKPRRLGQDNVATGDGIWNVCG
jgi:hypothetical protein